jgi:hypothetical protein
VTILFTRESSPAYCRIFYISIVFERCDLKSYHKIFLSADDRTPRKLGHDHHNNTHNNNNNRHRISVMELGHLLARSGLTYP